MIIYKCNIIISYLKRIKISRIRKETNKTGVVDIRHRYREIFVNMRSPF